MSTDLTVVLQDRPGELARLGQATGEAGVNIQGMCAFTGEGRGIIHVLVDDDQAAVARQALEEAGMGVADEREALVVDVEDRPGTLGELARSLGEAGVNIELAYTIFGGVKLVITTDDLDSARAALGLGVCYGARLAPGDVLGEGLEGCRRSAPGRRRSGRSRASTPPRRRAS